MGVAALLLLAVLALGTAWGQTGNGSVRGTVRDQTAAVIPDAAVVLTNTATNVELRTGTNSAGLYVFPAVPPGAYRITIGFAGMADYQAALTVQVQESSNIDVMLRPAATTTAVEVTDVSPIVVSDNATLGHVLETKRIEGLPINGRQLTNLLWTVPGVTFDNRGTGSTPRIRTFGEGPSTHDISLDGSPLTDMVNGETAITRQPSLESVQEFRVETSAGSARSPRPTNIVMTTRGGTNSLHGSLFETNRDNYYGLARRREDGNTPGKYIRNEYGFSSGGPVYLPKIYNGRNRTFWFFAWEQLRQVSGNTSSWRVPTDPMREGDFSGLTVRNLPVTLYNPFTTDGRTYQRQPFAYGGKLNAIDPALASPLWKYMMSILPHANRPGVNPTAAANYFAPAPDNTKQSTWSMRLDHRLGEKDQLYGRLSDATHHRKFNYGGVPSTDGTAGFRSYVSPNKTAAADWTHTFSPTFFNEVMVSATRTLNASAMGDGDNSILWATRLGLPNPGNQSGYPVFGSLGFTASGNFWDTPLVRSEYFTYYVVEDNATKIVGKHEIQFGFHGRRDLLTYLPQQQRAGGALSFPVIATALYSAAYPNRTNYTANTGFSAAGTFLGVANYEYRLVKSKYYMRRNEAASYIQDNFRVSPRLTLNLGLRWDFNPALTEKNNVFTSFDLKNGAIVLGRDLGTLYALNATQPFFIEATQRLGLKYETVDQAGLPYHMVYNNWRDLSPHIGFAYRALEGRKSFVLRGGYAVNYFPVPMYGWNDYFKRNTPFYSQYANNTLTSAVSSPDGVQNYGLVSVPTIIAGRNSTDAISFSNLNPSTMGLGSNFEANFFDPSQPSARVHTWNVTLEKEIVPNHLLRVSYNGNHGAHLESYEDLNESLTNVSDYNWYARTGRPLPSGPTADMQTNSMPASPMGPVTLWRKDGWSNANGMTAEFERRFTKGFGFQAFYQLVNSARAAGEGWNIQTHMPTAFPTGQLGEDRTARMRRLLYGRDNTVPQQELRFNWTVELPFGRGKMLGRNMSRILDAVAGGWQVTGMGRFRSNHFLLPNPQQTYSTLYDVWPTGNPVEYYGHKYPIQDCRSGNCQPGYLLTNGYIPAYLINKPNGIMGVPADYKPAAAPLWPYPANYPSLNPDTDPNYDRYGSNDVLVKLSDGSQIWTPKGDVHPWWNSMVASTWLSNTDASIFKLFKAGERVTVRVQCDFFNVFNQPGTGFAPLDETGIVTTQYSVNTPRQMQLSARISW